MRPGRLDRILFVGPPDKSGREEILKIRIKTMTVGDDVDISHIAQLVEFFYFLFFYYYYYLHYEHTFFFFSMVFDVMKQTEGCSGAEITSLCQEAAILTMQNNMNAPCVSFIFYYPS